MLKYWKVCLRSFPLLSVAAFSCLAGAQEATVEQIAVDEVRESQATVPQRRLITTIVDETATNENVSNLNTANAQGLIEEKPLRSEYWIGVQLEEPSDLLKSQLKLENGIVVVEVFDDSPAKKAGIEMNDILLRVGDSPIAGPTTLIQAIEAAKEAALDVELLRGGNRKTISVTPIKRPEPEIDPELQRTETRTPEELRAEMNRLDAALKALEAARGSTDRPLRFSFVHPQAGITSGRIVTAKPVPDLPADMTITITKAGEKPAKIVIKRDGNSWETTEDSLGGLPDEIRGYVNRLLPGHAHSTLHVRELQLHPGQNIDPHVLRRSTTVAPPPVPPAAPVTQPSAQYPHGWPVPHPPARATTPSAAPATPAPPTATRAYRAYVDGGARAAEAKLDAILKKLDALSRDKVEAMESELKKLRSEVDELRKDKK